MKEIWKDMPGYEGLYKVSSFGRVKLLVKRDKGIVIKRQTRIIKQHISHFGYRCSQVSDLNRVFKGIRVARMVALAFIPNPENKEQVNHIDGNKQNDHVRNLEWVTNRENCQHAHDKGLVKCSRGENHFRAKLKEKDVINILKLVSKGKKLTVIADKYNISPTVIHNIKSGKIWKHIPRKGLK